MKALRLIPVFGAPIEITKDVLVGRDSSCDVVISDGSISRRHARIEWRGENWAVVDQASANGTFVDSQRVAEAGLRNGQELRLGGVPLKVEIEGEAEDMGATISTPGPGGATLLQPSPLGQPPAPRPSSMAPPAPPRPQRLPPRPPAAPAPPRPADISITASLSPRPRAIDPPRPPAPPPRRRGPLFWVATGCCGCLGLVVLIAAVVGGGFYFLTRGPVDAVRGQLAEIKQGELDRAYARLSREAGLSREDFEKLVAGNAALRQYSEALFWFPEGSVHVVNDRAEVTGVLVSPRGREEAAFKLAKEGGTWKILSIRVGSEAGQGSQEQSRGLQVETTRVQKESKAPGGTEVTIHVRVRGFESRLEGTSHRVDLVEDLETLGPDGLRIENLSQHDFYRYAKPQPAAPDFADFETTLRFPQAAAGQYRCRLTIRDVLGGRRRVHEVPFQLP